MKHPKGYEPYEWTESPLCWLKYYWSLDRYEDWGEE